MQDSREKSLVWRELWHVLVDRRFFPATDTDRLCSHKLRFSNPNVLLSPSATSSFILISLSTTGRVTAASIAYSREIDTSLRWRCIQPHCVTALLADLAFPSRLPFHALPSEGGRLIMSFSLHTLLLMACYWSPETTVLGLYAGVTEAADQRHARAKKARGRLAHIWSRLFALARLVVLSLWKLTSCLSVQTWPIATSLTSCFVQSHLFICHLLIGEAQSISVEASSSSWVVVPSPIVPAGLLDIFADSATFDA